MPRVHGRNDYPHFHDVQRSIENLIESALVNVGFATGLNGLNRGKPVTLKKENSLAVQVPYFRVFMDGPLLDTDNMRLRSGYDERVMSSSGTVALLDPFPVPYILNFVVEIVSDRYDDYLRILESVAFHIHPRSEIEVELNHKTENERICALKYQVGGFVNFERNDEFRTRFNFEVNSFVSRDSIESLKTIADIDIKGCTEFFFDRDNFEAGE